MKLQTNDIVARLIEKVPSLEGINASSTGLTVAAGVSLFMPMSNEIVPIVTILITFFLLLTNKIPSYALILIGLLLGFIFHLLS